MHVGTLLHDSKKKTKKNRKYILRKKSYRPRKRIRGKIDCKNKKQNTSNKSKNKKSVNKI